MKKKPTTVAFQGTAEQEEMLIAVIEKYRGVKGAMMPILQEAQEIYGYLPIEVQKIVANITGVSVEEIYGIVSFYSQFMLNPKGEIAISVCLGTAYYVKGSLGVLERIKEKLKIETGGSSVDGKYSLDATRCVGACGLAPVMIINNDVYGRVRKDEVDAIIAKY
jgi:NADP-reducing hydrogenase subunit HndA